MWDHEPKKAGKPLESGKGKKKFFPGVSRKNVAQFSIMNVTNYPRLMV